MKFRFNFGKVHKGTLLEFDPKAGIAELKNVIKDATGNQLTLTSVFPSNYPHPIQVFK